MRIKVLFNRLNEKALTCLYDYKVSIRNDKIKVAEVDTGRAFVVTIERRKFIITEITWRDESKNETYKCGTLGQLYKTLGLA